MDPRNQPSLLERIYSWENLLDAYHEAASEKWYRYKLRPYTLWTASGKVRRRDPTV